MCIGGKVKTPDAPPPTAPAATAASMTESESVVQSRDRERKRMAAAMSQAALNKTGGGVSSGADVAKKKLLGE